MNVKSIVVTISVFIALSVWAEEVCIVERQPIINRIENRQFPSVFGAWHHTLLNYERPADIWEWEYTKNMLTHHDLFWGGIFRGTQWRFDSGDSQIVSIGGTDYDVQVKNEITNLNPNFLYLASLYYYGAHPENYPEDWKYWLRDKDGNRIQDEGWAEYLIDYTLPGAIDHFVQRAVAIENCGLHDGIFMDWWDESQEWDQEGSDIYHGSKVDALVLLVKSIREAVGDDFLIMVNTNTRKIPRSAPYVNGAFMEAIGTVDGYTRERLLEIEDSLTWYEENLRYPQVNCLEGWGIPTMPLNSPRNQQQARAIITLGLTHSNGYISYVPGIVSPNHEHQYEIWEGHSDEHEAGVFHGHTHQKYWYDLYDVDLGKPISEKAQNYNGIEGLFIREFTNGWTVYNRSGKAQTINLPNSTGVASQKSGTEHIIPDLDGEIYLKSKNSMSTDINGDGIINILDLVLVANGFGTPEPDINRDGIVNILDLVIVLKFGQSYSIHAASSKGSVVSC